MSRLTARTAQGLPYLVNVKDDEQEVDSPQWAHLYVRAIAEIERGMNQC